MNKTYFRLMRWVARRIFPKRKLVYGDGVSPIQRPCIIVCNHSGAMGPCVMEMDFTFPKRIWLTSSIMDRQTSANYIYHDFMFGRCKKHPKRWRRIAKGTSKLLIPILEGYDGVLLVHKEGRALLNTMEDSVATLYQGKNLVVFPEGHVQYATHINMFNRGFVKVAQRYARKYNTAIDFYPAYIGKGLRTVNIGAPITYDMEADYHQEAERICQYLQDSIEHIATNLPPHKVMPYVDDKFYQYYGEYVGNEVAYYQLVSQNYSE